MEKLLISVPEMGKRLDISLSIAWGLTKRKDFPVVRIGRRVLIPVRELEAWISKQSEAAKLEDE